MLPAKDVDWGVNNACVVDDLLVASSTWTATADAAAKEALSLLRLFWIFSWDARRKRHW